MFDPIELYKLKATQRPNPWTVVVLLLFVDIM